jgi:hypothetical protein
MKSIFFGLVLLSGLMLSTMAQDKLDISEFKITGEIDAAAELQDTLQRTGGYKGGEKGTINVVQDDSLPLEAVKVRITDDTVTIAGNPARWAVYEFLGQRVGVRYLWPGEIGTYVPQMAPVLIEKKDIDFRPELLRRDFRQNRSKQQSLIAWCDKHYLSTQRTPKGLSWGHAQHDWFEKYGKTMPELFAVNPKGKVGIWGGFSKPDRAKLRISSPKVVEMVVQEWIQKGKPDGICLSPTDSPGYDTSPETMAMDPVPYPKEAVWSGKGANLTDRHVKYWNRVYEKVKVHNPKVKVAVYAYGAYREPPDTVKLIPNVYHISMVPSWYEADKRIWKGWGEQAEAMYLRPNWPFSGYSAPYFQLKHMGDFIRFAYQHKMKGFDVDSITPFFGMRGPFNYMICRMMAHPELDPEVVLNEFYSGFGAAAEDVRKHYEYWEEYSNKVAMPVTAGGGVGGNENGLYLRTMKEHKFSTSALAGSLLMLPYLYKDDVLNPGIEILKGGLSKVSGEDKQRLQFLIDAYEPLKVQRELVAIYIDLMYKSKDKSLTGAMAAKNKEYVECYNRVYKGVAVARDGLNKWLKDGLKDRKLDEKSLQGL